MEAKYNEIRWVFLEFWRQAGNKARGRSVYTVVGVRLVACGWVGKVGGRG